MPMKRLALLLAAVALVLAARSSDGDDATSETTTAGGETSATTASADDGGSIDTEGLPSFDDVAAIGAALGCELEYDGIVDADREYSTCVYEGEQALIYRYTDPAVVADVAGAGAPALVYGANWTIEVDTAPVAESAASATGGTVAPPA